MREVREHKAFN